MNKKRLPTASPKRVVPAGRIQTHLTPPHLTTLPIFPLLCTLNALPSAAAAGSVLNSVTKYSPKNRTSVCGNPLPCAKAAGLLTAAPKFGRAGPVDLDGAEPEPEPPRVWPLPEKYAPEEAAGPLAASAAAARTAVRRAVGFAPRMVSLTCVPLRMRKVGMLCGYTCQFVVVAVAGIYLGR